jgi:hypothetical protein
VAGCLDLLGKLRGDGGSRTSCAVIDNGSVTLGRAVYDVGRPVRDTAPSGWTRPSPITWWWHSGKKRSRWSSLVIMGRRLSPDQRRTINRLLAGRDFDEGQVRLTPRFASLILASTAETLKALLRPRLHEPVNSTLPHS